MTLQRNGAPPTPKRRAAAPSKINCMQIRLEFIGNKKNREDKIVEFPCSPIFLRTFKKKSNLLNNSVAGYSIHLFLLKETNEIYILQYRVPE